MLQSQNKIDSGSKSVNKSGESLVEIVNKVQEVNKLITEIATASSEQSIGMSQISTAMSELDQATHSNSISSIETAKFGQLLKHQAEDLNDAIQNLAKIVYG